MPKEKQKPQTKADKNKPKSKADKEAERKKNKDKKNAKLVAGGGMAPNTNNDKGKPAKKK